MKTPLYRNKPLQKFVDPNSPEIATYGSERIDPELIIISAIYYLMVIRHDGKFTQEVSDAIDILEALEKLVRVTR